MLTGDNHQQFDVNLSICNRVTLSCLRVNFNEDGNSNACKFIYDCIFLLIRYLIPLIVIVAVSHVILINQIDDK